MNFSRLVERSLTAVLSALLCLTASQLQAAERPLNVLLILVDDLAPVISSYGGPVTTPAIDELAQRGVRFSNNYANVPVCGASRASMLGGLAPNATRFLTYDSRLDRDVTGSVSLPAYFKQHGWHTAAIGKVFDVIEDSAAGWTDPVWSPDPDWYGKQPDGRGEHLQAAYIDPVGDGRLPYFERLDVADADYPDGQVAERAVADLQRLAVGTAPFFLAVGFRKPHLPFNAPEQYWQSADTAPTPLPASWHRPAANVPRQALHRSPELRGQYDALPLVGDVSDAAAQEIAGAYHAAVRYIDAQVGSVLDALTAVGAADNTLVVLMGDHGFFLGEQRMWTKHALFEPALRTPLIVAHPRFASGKAVSAVTDLLDVYPTVVELAGLTMPAHLEGASLLPLLANPELVERRTKPASVSRWMNGESVRRGDYRYTRWFDKHDATTAEMLFNLRTDPNEQMNLADAAEHNALITELRSVLLSQRSGPVWSAQLGTQNSRWQLASSSTGAVLLIAMTYPISVAIGLVMVFVVAVYWFVRRRRRRQAVG